MVGKGLKAAVVYMYVTASSSLAAVGPGDGLLRPPVQLSQGLPVHRHEGSARPPPSGCRGHRRPHAEASAMYMYLHVCVWMAGVNPLPTNDARCNKCT